MGNLKAIKDRINGHSDDFRVNTFNTLYDNLCAVSKNENEFYSMSPKEMYAHVRALHQYIRTLHGFQHDRLDIANEIINAWVTLNEEIEKNPELGQDWAAFLCVMKMTD